MEKYEKYRRNAETAYRSNSRWQETEMASANAETSLDEEFTQSRGKERIK